MSIHNTIAENPNSTVVSEYPPDKNDATQYQSEHELDLEFIDLLKNNGYDYLDTIRNAHLKEQQGSKSHKKTSNGFEFTCWWTDAQNKRISDLVNFSKTFFSKHPLLSNCGGRVHRKNYGTFMQVIEEFKKRYRLTECSRRDIDVYLWLTGKNYFPK